MGLVAREAGRVRSGVGRGVGPRLSCGEGQTGAVRAFLGWNGAGSSGRGRRRADADAPRSGADVTPMAGCPCRRPSRPAHAAWNDVWQSCRTRIAASRSGPAHERDGSLPRSCVPTAPRPSSCTTRVGAARFGPSTSPGVGDAVENRRVVDEQVPVPPWAEGAELPRVAPVAEHGSWCS